MKIIFQYIIVAVAMFTSVAAQADDKGRLFVIGDATTYGWDLDKAQALLSNGQEPNVFTGTLYLKGDQIFKFMEAHEWGSTEYGLPTEAETAVVSGEFTLATGELDNGYQQIKVAQDGNYIISVNIEKLTANIELSNYQDTEIKCSALFMVGSATDGGWSVEDGTPLYQSSETPYEYSATVKLKASPESFKIATALKGAGSWNPDYFYFKDADDAGKISTDSTDDRQWSVAENGNYAVKVNTVSNTISIEKVTTAGIEAIVAYPVNVGGVSYFNLQGQKVSNPSNGVFIEVSGNDVRKVILH